MYVLVCVYIFLIMNMCPFESQERKSVFENTCPPFLLQYVIVSCYCHKCKSYDRIIIVSAF